MSDEKFEAYWKDRCAKQHPYSTVNMKTVAEEAWQASRAALKVELPAGKPWFAAVTEEEELRKHRGYGWNDCLDAVGEALQQAGIEVVK